MDSLKKYLNEALENEEITICDSIIIQDSLTDEVLTATDIESLLDSDSNCLSFNVVDSDRDDTNTLIVVVDVV